MFALITAEAAIFTIFVVAYLFYIGKSLTGPFPKDVLSVTCFLHHLFAFQQFDDSSGGKIASPRRRSKFRMPGGFSTIALGAAFMYGTATEWHRLIYKEGLTISTNLFGTTYYSLVGLHGFHVVVGLLSLSLVMTFTLLGDVRPEHAERIDVLSLYWHFVDVVWIVVFTVVYVIGR